MEFLHSQDAPAAIGPYSQAVQSGRLVFCSGQTPVDPVSMKVFGSEIATQTERALMNLSMVLHSKNLSLSHVIKVNVYLKEMSDFVRMNEVYGKVFGSHRPARTTIQVAGLPLDALVEIECIAEIAA